MIYNNILAQVSKWIYRNARPLELARWQYHFEKGGAEAVIKALEAYQNIDGGFGHALECDCWNPISSPIQTFHAIQILGELDIEDKKLPIIQGILQYLESGADVQGETWLNTVITNNDYPHAPWWHTSSESSSHDCYNPTAGLIGFSLYFADQKTELFKKCMTLLNDAIEYVKKAENMDMHVLACFITLLEYCKLVDFNLPFSIKELEEKLIILVSKNITQDTSLWATNYVCKPSQFFDSPDSIFYLMNKTVADYEREFILNSRNSDGVWDVTWGWEAYPEEWALSKNWWKGHIAVNNMLYLRNML